MSTPAGCLRPMGVGAVELKYPSPHLENTKEEEAGNEGEKRGKRQKVARKKAKIKRAIRSKYGDRTAIMNE